MPERSGKASAALGLAIAGLVTSIVGIGLIFSIAAIVLSRKATREIDASNGQMGGADRAIWARSLGMFSAVVGGVMLAIGVAIPLVGTPRRAGCNMKNGTKLTAISKNMIMWSDQYYQESQDFPRVGLIPDPNTFGFPRGIPTNSPTDRIAALVNMTDDPLSPQMLVNPIGTDVAAQGTTPNIVLSSKNLSYAFLDALNKEWKNKVNASAPLLADKQVGKGTYWNKKNWEGNVVWGDTHVTWESGEKADSWPSTTINGQTNAHDDLFKGTTGPEATDAVLFNP